MLTGPVEKFKKNNQFTSALRVFVSHIYEYIKMSGFPATRNSSARLCSGLFRVGCDFVRCRIYIKLFNQFTAAEVLG